MNTTIKPKHQRLVLLVVAVIAMIGATLLAIVALRDQASYFYLPSEIGAAETGRDIRLGGMVEHGSIVTQEDGITIHFIVGDGEARQPVSFTGIAPALFVEGSGVVAEGSMAADGTFMASNLLAKHDENYMPRELAELDTDEVRAQIEATLQ